MNHQGFSVQPRLLQSSLQQDVAERAVLGSCRSILPANFSSVSRIRRVEVTLVLGINESRRLHSTTVRTAFTGKSGERGGKDYWFRHCRDLSILALSIRSIAALVSGSFGSYCARAAFLSRAGELGTSSRIKQKSFTSMSMPRTQ